MADPSVARLEQTAEKATPGPWECDRVAGGWEVVEAHVGTLIAEVSERDMSDADAEFIAAASPDVVAGLCARVRELETAGEEAHRLLAGICGATDFERVSSPAMRQRMRRVRDALAAALVVSRPGEDTNHG